MAGGPFRCDEEIFYQRPTLRRFPPARLPLLLFGKHLEYTVVIRSFLELHVVKERFFFRLGGPYSLHCIVFHSPIQV